MERRMRRTQDRSRTQPVTTEEVVIAATYVTVETADGGWGFQGDAVELLF